MLAFVAFVTRVIEFVSGISTLATVRVAQGFGPYRHGLAGFKDILWRELVGHLLSSVHLPLQPPATQGLVLAHS